MGLKAISAAAVACLLLAARPAQADDSSLRVVSFSGELKILSGNSIIVLKPGSPGFDLPPGSDVTILAGEATLLGGSSLIRARQDDRFIFLLGDGRPLLSIQAGSIEITAEGRTKSYGPGQLAALGGPHPPAPALPAALQVEPSAPAPPPPPPPAPPAEEEPSRLKLQIELHPYAGLKQTYDSNIYLVPPDKPNGEIVGGGVRGSWITNASMGLKLSAPLSRRHSLEAEYEANLLKYSQQPSANDSANQSVSGSYKFSGRKVTGRAFDQYINTEDPAFSELVARERRWQNTAGGSLEFLAGRSLAYGVDGQHTVHKYLGRTLGGFLNRYEQSFGGSAGILLAPKTKVFAAYHRQIIHYSASRASNSKGHSLDLGIEGDIAPQLRGKASGGFSYRRYDTLSGTLSQETVNWQMGVDLKYRLARRTELSLTANRSVNEATFGLNRFSVGTGAALGVRHSWRKFLLSLDGGLQVDRYPESTDAGGLSANRRDDTYSGTAGVLFKIREWLSSSFSFQRVQRHSIFTRQFNYEVNRTAFELKATF